MKISYNFLNINDNFYIQNTQTQSIDDLTHAGN